MDTLLGSVPLMADPPDVTHISTLASSSVTPGPVVWKKTPVKTYSKKFTSPPAPVEGDTGDASGDKSRYGRARKPRPSGDFLSTDRMVSNYLKVRTEDQFFNFRATYSNPRIPARKVTKQFSAARRSLPASVTYTALNSSDGSEENNLDLAAPTSTETVETPIHLQEYEVKSETSEVESDAERLEFIVGDLVWAAISGYPYWPAVVTRDPISNLIFKTQGYGKKTFHVNFFGDSGMRGWVYSKNMFIFSLEEFNAMKEQCLTLNEGEMTPFARKTHRQRKKLFSVSESQFHSWTSAMNEAKGLLSSSRNNRLEYFMTTYITKKENKSKMRAWSSTMSLNQKNKKATKDSSSKATPTKRMRSFSSTGTPAGGNDGEKMVKSGDRSVVEGSSAGSSLPFKAPSHGPPRTRKPIPRTPTSVVPISRKRFSLQALRSPSPTASGPSPRKRKAKSTSSRDTSESLDMRSPLLNDHEGGPTESPSPVASPPVKKKRTSALEETVVNEVEGELENDELTLQYAPKRSRGRPRKDSYDNQVSIPAELNRLKIDQPSTSTVPNVPQNGSKGEVPTTTRSGRLSVKPVPTYLPQPRRSKEHKNAVSPMMIKKESVSPDRSLSDSSSPRPGRKTLADTEAGKKKDNRNIEEAGGSKEGPRVQEPNKPSKHEQPSKMFIPKKTSLFTGAKDIKVCSICLKPGKVVRCRGPCSLHMHVECSDKPRFIVDSDVKPEPKVRKRSKKRRWADFWTKRKVEASGGLDGPLTTIEIKEENQSDVEGTGEVNDNGMEVAGDSHSLNGDHSRPISPKVEIPMDRDSKDSSSNNELAVPLRDQTDFSNSSGIPTPPPEENGKTPEPDVTSLYIHDDASSKTDDDCLMAPETSPGVPASAETAESITSETSEKDKMSCNGIKKENGKDKGWMCRLCVENQMGPCFSCGKDDGERLRCKAGYCGKVYHPECAQFWRQGSFQPNSKVFWCPGHSCHTCVSDNPGSLTSRYYKDKLVRCVRCPTCYHQDSYCVPAGSEILSATQIICPSHFRLGKKSLSHLNATWCFICSFGGSLICCELCPNSFCLKCLKISPPEGEFICEDCETGRYPLYGEIVWAKLGVYRWWPARILFPQEVPPSLQRADHVPGEFAVRFYGTFDYYWVNRGRVFPFHEGDGNKQNSSSLHSKKTTDEAFYRGIQEANHDFKIWSELKAEHEKSHRPAMKPPKYVKITSNKPVGSIRMSEADMSSLTACECKESDEDPCGPNSQCINRLLLVECSAQTCPAMEKCTNQNFEKRLYPPLVPFRTASKGWGLKTVGPLKKGDFIIEYVGEMIDEEEYKRRLQEMHRSKNENFYFLTLDKERMLDAGPKGNLSRFMNHSCQPNCETQKWTVEGNTRVGLFALQDIPADSELVFNYNLMSAGDSKLECRCGAPNCAGFIGGKPIKPAPNKTKPKDGSNSKVKGLKLKKKRKYKRKIKNLAKLALTNSCSLNGCATPKATNKDEAQKCSMCNEGGATISCQEAQCTKMYHLSCTHLTKEPKQYTCPSHECSTCRSRDLVENCSLCINSYCSAHQEGNMIVNRGKKTLCRNCYESDSGSEWSSYGKEEDLTDSSLLARRT